MQTRERMNSIELARKVSLHPRAVVLTGAFKERTKNSAVGIISGYDPHYTIQGCPQVQFAKDGSMVPGSQDAAAIEALFIEQAPAELGQLTGSYGKPLNMVHLAFGRPGTSPNPAEVALLREAGEVFRRNEGRPVLLAALPTLATAAYGVSQGRFCPLGLFTEAGDPLWLNPIAVGSLLKAEYPANQVQRSTQPAPAPAPTPAPAAPQAPAEPHWYDRLSEVWSKKLRLAPGSKQLHATVLEKYAEYLIDFGRAKSKTEASAIAKKEFQEYDAAKAPAAPLPAQTSKPAKLSGAKV